MSTFVWPCLLLGISFGQDAKLEITSLRATYGHLGATRPKDGVLPGDTLFFTFDVNNLKFDKDATAKYSVEIKVVDDKGKLFFHQRPYNVVAKNHFGGRVVQFSSFLNVPLAAKPGPVHWTITIKDRTSNQTATAKGNGKILKSSFGLVQVGTFADARGQVPKAPVGIMGESFYLNFSLVGFARDKKTNAPDVRVQLRILDANGKPTTAKPMIGNVKDAPKNAHLLPLQFGLNLTRAGQFTLELTAACQICGAGRKIEIPLRVLELK